MPCAMQRLICPCCLPAGLPCSKDTLYRPPTCRRPLLSSSSQVLGENREDIVRIFQYWRFVNRRLDVGVHEIGGWMGGRNWVEGVWQAIGVLGTWGRRCYFTLLSAAWGVDRVGCLPWHCRLWLSSTAYYQSPAPYAPCMRGAGRSRAQGVGAHRAACDRLQSPAV